MSVAWVLVAGCTLDWDSVPRRDVDGSAEPLDMGSTGDMATVRDAAADAFEPDAGDPDMGLPCGAPCIEPAVCDPERGACVECYLGEHCISDLCIDNVCAECSATAPCEAGRACDVFQGRCVSPSLGVCEECTSDLQCPNTVAEHVCAPTMYGSTDAGAFCLPLAEGPCPNELGMMLTVMTLSGQSATVCAPNEALTTCGAIALQGRVCAMDDECGVLGDDGLCLDAGVCGIRCTSDGDCPFGSATCSIQGDGEMACEGA